MRGVSSAFATILFFVVATASALSSPDDRDGKFEALQKQTQSIAESGDLGKALSTSESALAFAKAAYGGEHENVVIAMNQRANLLLHLGRRDDAESQYALALAMCRKIGKEHSQAAATSVNGLASAALQGHRFAEAIPLYEQSLAMRRELTGAEDTESAISMADLALAYYNQRRFDESALLYGRALQAMEKSKGRDHYFLSPILNGQAMVFMALGEFDEAEPLLARSLTIRSKALGATHPFVGFDHHNLGVLYLQRGRASGHRADLELARRELQSAIAIRSRPDYGNIDDLHASQAELARVKEALGMLEKAKASLQHLEKR